MTKPAKRTLAAEDRLLQPARKLSRQLANQVRGADAQQVQALWDACWSDALARHRSPRSA